MTQEEMLKAYLKDDFFKENSYFDSDEEAEKVNWSDFPTDKNDPSCDKLLSVIKITIEDISNKEIASDNIKRKINKFLNE